MNLRTISHTLYPSSFRKRVEFLVRSFFYKQEILSLEVFFHEHGIGWLLEENPDIFQKPLYPYMIHPQLFKRRLRMVEDHFEGVSTLFTEEFLRKSLNDLIPIATYRVSEKCYTLSLGTITHFANEGEMTLGLYGENRERYYIASWNFVHDEDKGIMIGALQGTSDLEGIDAKEVVKNVTKDFEGLRPQILLVSVLGIIASLTGCKNLYGVRTKAHVYNAGRKIKRIKTDYDFFWEEAGGEKLDESLYALPLVYDRKPIEEVKSNKRAMYRRRYELLDSIEEQVKQNLFPYLHASLKTL